MFEKTPRNTVKRRPQRGVYDRDTVESILREGFICHLGYEIDGQPYVIPTSYGIAGDVIYMHGSAASRTMRALGTGIPVCMTVTIADGFVLARAAFHHSFNYRSVVVFGEAALVEDREEKLAAFEAFVEHVLPGRWQEVRQPTDQELKATAVVRLPLEEASAKIRTGPPVDEQEDLDLDVWAGIVPIGATVGAEIPDPELRAGIRRSDAVTTLASRYRNF